MSIGQPPQFTGDLKDWSRKLSEYLIRLQQNTGAAASNPAAPNLLHRIGNEKAVQDGTLMFDPTTGELNYAVGGQWKTPGIPSGGVIAWYGDIADIPSGWLLCDGTNGTPDLRDRFIIGAGGTYAVNDTGGSATINSVPAHSHGAGTLAADSGGAHTHSVSGSAASGGNNWSIAARRKDGTTSIFASASGITLSENGFGGSLQRVGNGSGSGNGDTLSYNAAHTHSVSGTAASGGAHGHTISGTTASTGTATVSVLNPYYALAFIMKA